jgi:hypothetical protein
VTYSSKTFSIVLRSICLICFFQNLTAQEWLDDLDESLSYQTANESVSFDLSGLLDMELLSIDQHPPDLIATSDPLFLQPRLSLFLDTHFGPHLYSFVHARADRGFDAGAEKDGDIRADEWLLRYTPFEDARVNLQAGKFATVVGNWVQRHDSWNNPFITAPLPYANMTTISDASVAATPAAFLGRRRIPDIKTAWVPVIWGPSYATGASVFGTIKNLDYAFEIKNAALSSRPEDWNPNDHIWTSPTFSGRAGVHPNEAWNFGVSASGGSYLNPNVEPSLKGKDTSDFTQYLLGTDVSYATGHFQIWSEVFLSRFEVPNNEDADTLAYYVEARYKLTPQFFAALRWNQQFFGEISNGSGSKQAWDNDIWKIEPGIAYRFSRHIQLKLQYAHSHQQSSFQQGENFVGTQLSVKF